MSKLRMVHFLTSLTVVTLIADGCGIVVGNPTFSGSGQGSKTSMISLKLTSLSSATYKSVYLNIKSASALMPISDNSMLQQVPLKLSKSGKIIISDGQNEQNLDLVDGAELAEGSYGGVVLGLDPVAPGAVIDNDGRELPLTIAGNKQAIAVTQKITVDSKKQSNFELVLDIPSSIQANIVGDSSIATSYSIVPVAYLQSKDVSGSVSGTISGDAASGTVATVCAYPSGDITSATDKNLAFPSQQSLTAGQLPAEVVLAQPPTRFVSAKPFDPAKNNTSCTQAFAISPVNNKSFNLNPLWAGTYQIISYDRSGVKINTAPSTVQIAGGQVSSVNIVVNLEKVVAAPSSPSPNNRGSNDLLNRPKD